jgi:hypothetical protein
LCGFARLFGCGAVPEPRPYRRQAQKRPSGTLVLAGFRAKVTQAFNAYLFIATGDAAAENKPSLAL